ncbi:hypothetical protein II906_07040, partial [bacterium]|nr:hypothetical protein [bacterium]
MAIKKKQVLTIDFSKEENVNYSAKNKTAINMVNVDDYSEVKVTADAKNLYFYNGDTLVATVSNYSKVKYTKLEEETSYTTDLINSEVIYEGAYIIKKGTVNGSSFNDIIEAENLDYEVPASKKGLVIKTGAGDDEITGTVGNDTITGGKGTTIVNYLAGDGNDVINLTKGEDFILNLEGVADDDVNNLAFEYTNKNKDLRIYINKNNKEEYITIKDFVKKDVTTGTGSALIQIGEETYDLRTNDKDGDYWYSVAVNGNFSGGWLNDHIDAKAAPEKFNKKGAHVDLVLKGGKGNDLIESSMYADNIYGGAGENIVKYTSLQQLDGDKINLTKGEKLSIDVSEIAGAEVTYEVVKNDLVVHVNDKSFKIVNFGTKDVASNATKKKADTSYVYLIIDGEDNPINLKEITANSEKGSWHNDFIDAHLTPVKIKNGKELTTGVSLDGKSGADRIIGSDFYDTMKGGAGNDTLTGGKGNDKLYGDAGVNTLIFNAGDGADTVYSGSGEDLLRFKDINLSDITFEKGKKDFKNDLIINYAEANEDGVSQVTVRDFYKKNKKGNLTTSVTLIETKEGVKSLEQAAADYFNSQVEPENPTGDRFLTDALTVNAYGGNDEIWLCETGYSTIKAGAGQDNIWINYSDNNLVYGEEGNDYFVEEDSKNNCFVFRSGDGNDTISSWNSESVIKFEDIELSGLTYAKLGEDLIINYGLRDIKDSIVIIGYFEEPVIDPEEEEFYDEPSTFTLEDKTGNKVLLSTVIDALDEIPEAGYYDIYEGTVNDDYISVPNVNGIHVNAGKGDDTISLWSSTGHELNGGEGNDSFRVGDGGNTIIGGKGNDYIDLDTEGEYDEESEVYPSNIVEFNSGDGRDVI